MSLTWTRREWVKWWGRCDNERRELRDLLWSVMVDTHRRAPQHHETWVVLGEAIRDADAKEEG